MEMVVGTLSMVKTVGMTVVERVESAISVAPMVTVARVTSMKLMETVRLRWNWPYESQFTDQHLYTCVFQRKWRTRAQIGIFNVE